MYSAERSQIFVVNWRKFYTICGVKAVPVGFVGGVVEKRNIVNLDGGGDDGSIDMGCVGQISQMSSIRHQSRVLVIAQIGPVIEQSVGGAGGENRVNRRVCGRYGEADGDGSAAGDLAGGLREKALTCGGEVVQHPLVFIVAAVQLLQAALQAGDGAGIAAAELVGNGNGKGQGVGGGVVGGVVGVESDCEFFCIFYADTGVKFADILCLCNISAVIADGGGAGAVVEIPVTAVQIGVGWEGGLAEKNGVNAAGGRGVFDAPAAVPQVLVHRGVGEEGGGRAGELIRSIVDIEIAEFHVAGAFIHVRAVEGHGIDAVVSIAQALAV